MSQVTGQGAISVGPAFAVVLAVLVAVAAVAALIGRLGLGRATVTASIRATLQLAVVSRLITAVLRSWWATAGFIALMLVVRRGHVGPPDQHVAAGLGGAAPDHGRCPADRCGHRGGRDDAADRGRGPADRALDFLPRDAAHEICRPTSGQTLIPALDQTRTVGLVTLPGAFVGVLLGGGSPVQAGATQLLVLVALLAVDAIAVAVTVEFVARGVLLRPDSRHGGRDG